LNRYPDRQSEIDADDMRVHRRTAKVRPGATLRVRGFVDGEPGPVILGRAVLTGISSGYGEKALVPSVEYGRAWFYLQGHPFKIIEET